MDFGGEEGFNDEFQSNYKLDDENTNNQGSSLLDMFLNDDNEDSVSGDSVLFISQRYDIES
jgi:hypothetical protein